MRRSCVVLLFLSCLFTYYLAAYNEIPVEAYQGAETQLGDGKTFRYDLALDANQAYNISLNVRSNVENAVIKLGVYFYDSDGEATDYITVSRGLGTGGNWHLIGLEFTAPSDIGRGELVLTADQPGTYWWDGITVQRINQSSDEVRQYWEDKFAKYGVVYTGLVIDARHLNVQRGISPRIYSESGQLIYGGVLASPDFVQDIGVVAYGTELTPRLLERIQVDPDYGYAVPLVVDAVDVIDPARTSVSISDQDAQRILEALARYDFLARYAVIFLIS